MNTDRGQIRSMAEGQDHEKISDMDALIQSVALAISISESILYEICAYGLPLIAYSLADNQLPGTNAFEKLEVGINI